MWGVDGVWKSKFFQLGENKVSRDLAYFRSVHQCSKIYSQALTNMIFVAREKSS